MRADGVGLRRLTVAALLVLLAGTAGPALAQNVTEWSTESRIALNFKAPADAVQRLLPPGWTVAPSESPATAGANLNVTLMERQMVLDPQGKPIRTGTTRYIVLTVPARNTQTGQAATMAVRGISPDAPGAYGVYLKATTSRVERTMSGEAETSGRVQEQWDFAAASGEQVRLRATYRRAAAGKTHVETVVRSAAHPEFQRTYRIDQISDVLRNATTPGDRLEQIEFRASGPAFAPLFDGSETLVAVTAVPYYVREISIP